MPQKGTKTSTRKMLLQVKKTTGKTPRQLLDMPDKPTELSYLWEWWIDIKCDERITNAEILAWSKLMNIKLIPWEVDVIKTLDRIMWRAALNA